MNNSGVSNWISNLATIVSGLSGEQILALAEFYGGNESVVVPSTTEIQRKLSLATTAATSLARNLREVSSSRDVTGRDIRIAMASLAHGRMIATGNDKVIEVVCTAPSRFGIPVRTTFATAVEMIRAARHETVMVGYVFTEGARELLKELAEARRDRGVRVMLIGNRMHECLPILDTIWPADSPRPQIFTREIDPEDPMAALHAKLLICDNDAALVTSANFSYHGLHENIEIGVKVRSAAMARLVELFQAMIANGDLKPLL
jgi:nucleotide-binding universal stress UspA family protein